MADKFDLLSIPDIATRYPGANQKPKEQALAENVHLHLFANASSATGNDAITDAQRTAWAESVEKGYVSLIDRQATGLAGIAKDLAAAEKEGVINTGDRHFKHVHDYFIRKDKVGRGHLGDAILTDEMLKGIQSQHFNNSSQFAHNLGAMQRPDPNTYFAHHPGSVPTYPYGNPAPRVDNLPEPPPVKPGTGFKISPITPTHVQTAPHKPLTDDDLKKMMAHKLGTLSPEQYAKIMGHKPPAPHEADIAQNDKPSHGLHIHSTGPKGRDKS